jgi:uncharacterized protein
MPNMKTKHPYLSRWLACAVLACGVTAGFSAEAKKMLVVTVTFGFPHSSVTTAEKVLTDLGQKSGLYTVDVVRSGPRPKEKADEEKWVAKATTELGEKMSLEGLKKYDIVFFANTTGDLPLPDKEGFLNWIKSGKSFMGVHSASDTFHNFQPYIEMIGGEFLTHGAQVTVDCVNQDKKHPATKDLPNVYTLKDEIYILKNFHRDQVHGLLTLDKHPNSGMPGDYPIAWCKQYGDGKVFYSSLGHREDVWESETYQAHILGAIKWSLGVEEGSAKPQALRYTVPKKEKEEGFRALFNGKDLEGWKLRNPSGTPSWSPQNRMLVNVVPPGGHGTDLVSEEKFKDFTIRFEYMVPKGANSGLYLRGRHELQIYDDFDKKTPAPGGNGAIYNLKPVSEFASKEAGKWNQVEATIQGNKVTVTLNGVKVHDNVVVDRATGGELDKNVNEPGPIMLQGDHGSVAFRRIRVKTL